MNQFIPLRNISCDGGNLTSDAGAIPLFDFISNAQLLSLYRNLPYQDSRLYCKKANENFQIFTQILFRYLLGYFSQEDQIIFQKDPLLKDFIPCSSSQSTVSRFYKRVNQNTINHFWRTLMNQACSFVDSQSRTIVLDADSTVIKTYGHQEEAGYISHYKAEGYHPLVIFDENTQVIVAAFNRPGNTYSSHEIEGIIETVLNKFKKEHSILFRGDSAFYNSSLMNILETRGANYVIRIKNYKKLVQSCIEDCSKRVDLSQCKENLGFSFQGEILYETSQGEKSRVCYELSYDFKGKERIFGVITNLKTETTEEVLNLYRQRGASENYIKELKNGFDAQHLSHQSFIENTFEFLLKSLTYNLFKIFQRLVLKGRDRKMTVNTWRMVYQKVVAKIVKHGGKISLKMASSFKTRWKRFRRYLIQAREVREVT